jgi:hypothetical protein
VWRWHEGWGTDDNKWKGCLANLFGQPDYSAIHLEFIANIDSEHARHVAKEVLQIAQSRYTESGWYGTRTNGPVVDWSSGGRIEIDGGQDEQFALVVKMASAKEVTDYYKQLWTVDSIQRQYAGIDKVWARILEAAGDNEVLRQTIMAVAKAKVFAADYVNCETFDSIVGK